MTLLDKIVLGTVQFGLDYGVNNQQGQVSSSEVNSILELAYNNGIRTLDTSSAYGNSESVLGTALKGGLFNFKIISKYPLSDKNVESVFRQSLSDLYQQQLYGYLVHHFDFYQSHPSIWDEMLRLKEIGSILKIGFSLYSPEQLEYLFDHNIEFDILQFPYNIFDRQFEPYLEGLKDKGVEIHTRSAFLQGLFFKDLRSLNSNLSLLKPHLQDLHRYCEEEGIAVEQLALNYVALNTSIDGVLIGVDNSRQLQSNINVLSRGLRAKDIDYVNSITVQETRLLNPVNWK